MKYVKKPIVIDAVLYNGFGNAGQPRDIFSERPTWLNFAINNGIVILDDLDEPLKIKTLEGTMRANNGDWIIQGVNGEIYPCKPDIFEKTYDIIGE